MKPTNPQKKNRNFVGWFIFVGGLGLINFIASIAIASADYRKGQPQFGYELEFEDWRIWNSDFKAGYNANKGKPIDVKGYFSAGEYSELVYLTSDGGNAELITKAMELVPKSIEDLRVALLKKMTHFTAMNPVESVEYRFVRPVALESFVPESFRAPSIAKNGGDLVGYRGLHTHLTEMGLLIKHRYNPKMGPRPLISEVKTILTQEELDRVVTYVNKRKSGIVGWVKGDEVFVEKPWFKLMPSKGDYKGSDLNQICQRVDVSRSRLKDCGRWLAQESALKAKGGFPSWREFKARGSIAIGEEQDEKLTYLKYIFKHIHPTMRFY